VPTGLNSMSEDEWRRNLRTALILLSIVVAFFAGVIAKYWVLS